MALSVDAKHIKYKKAIGKLKSNPVWEILTTGGLYMEIVGKDGGFDVVGTGPHRGIARYIAEQRAPGIEWNELAKSDAIDYAAILYLLPKYNEVTDEIIARKKRRDEERE